MNEPRFDPTRDETLPEFGQPPLVEMVLGVTFRNLDNLLVPHVGVLWALFASDFPEISEAPVLPAMFESFGSGAGTEVRLNESNSWSRVWFSQPGGGDLIQIQHERFLYNWRKRKLDEPFPGFSHIFRRFDDQFSRFRQFLTEANLGDVDPEQYELTYVNHIPSGEGWNSLADVGLMFLGSPYSVAPPKFLAQVHSLQWLTSFDMPENRGRLHVSLRSAQRSSDKRPVLILEITARGMSEDRSRKGLFDWFHEARNWIVRAFAELTPEEAQVDFWKRRQP